MSWRLIKGYVSAGRQPAGILILNNYNFWKKNKTIVLLESIIISMQYN